MDTELLSRLLAAQHRHIDQGVEGIVDGSGEPQALKATDFSMRLKDIE